MTDSLEREMTPRRGFPAANPLGVRFWAPRIVLRGVQKIPVVLRKILIPTISIGCDHSTDRSPDLSFKRVPSRWAVLWFLIEHSRPGPKNVQKGGDRSPGFGAPPRAVLLDRPGESFPTWAPLPKIPKSRKVKGKGERKRRALGGKTGPGRQRGGFALGPPKCVTCAGFPGRWGQPTCHVMDPVSPTKSLEREMTKRLEREMTKSLEREMSKSLEREMTNRKVWIIAGAEALIKFGFLGHGRVQVAVLGWQKAGTVTVRYLARLQSGIWHGYSRVSGTVTVGYLARLQSGIWHGYSRVSGTVTVGYLARLQSGIWHGYSQVPGTVTVGYLARSQSGIWHGHSRVSGTVTVRYLARLQSGGTRDFGRWSTAAVRGFSA